MNTAKPTTQSTAKAPVHPSRSANQPTPKGWDAVDEANLESFPASDPPVGWAGKDLPASEETVEEVEEEQRAETD